MLHAHQRIRLFPKLLPISKGFNLGVARTNGLKTQLIQYTGMGSTKRKARTKVDVQTLYLYICNILTFIDEKLNYLNFIIGLLK